MTKYHQTGVQDALVSLKTGYCKPDLPNRDQLRFIFLGLHFSEKRKA